MKSMRSTLSRNACSTHHIHTHTHTHTPVRHTTCTLKLVRHHTITPSHMQSLTGSMAEVIFEVHSTSTFLRRLSASREVSTAFTTLSHKSQQRNNHTDETSEIYACIDSWIDH
jgi:phage-related tail protein